MGQTYFISYTAKDEQWAEWIADVLETQGQTVMLQARNIRPGDDFIIKMEEMLSECDVCICVLSPKYLESVYCQAEWVDALDMAIKGKKRIVPVRLEEVELPTLLRTRVYIDLHKIDDAQDAERRILVGLGVVERPRGKTPFPRAADSAAVEASKPRAAFPGGFSVYDLEEYQTAEEYYEKEDYPHALAWYYRALAICEMEVGMEHLDTAVVHDKIGYMHERLRYYPAALEWYYKALAIYEKVLGTEHPDTAATYLDIGSANLLLGDYPPALEWLMKSYQIFKQKLGDTAPETIGVKDLMQETFSQLNLPEPFDTWFAREFTQS